MSDKYSIGEIVILDKDVEVTNLIGDTKTIRKGSKAIVTAAGNFRYFSGNAVSPLDYDIELERYDAGGIAEYIVHQISCFLPITEMLDSQGLTKAALVEEIEIALLNIDFD